jgi:hypothetical protein
MSEQPVRRMSAAEITSEAERHIDNYLDGGYDLEANDVQAAVDAGVDPKAIAAIWAHAKTLRPSGPKPADFFSPTTLPKDVPVAQAQPKPANDWAAERARLNKKLGAKPEAKPEEAKSQPEPEVEAEVETEPQATVQLPAVVPPQPAKWDEAIDLLNTRHAIIDNVGGKTMIASWEPSPLDPSRLVVVFQSKESLLLRYSNRSVSVPVLNVRGVSGTGSMALGQWWLGHRGRRQFRGVTFLPRGDATVSGCLNLWRGWGIDPVQGDWSLIREHIEEVVAGGDVEVGDYVVRWIAWAIQHPDRQAEVALVLIGAKGVGKGTLVRVLERIFGAHAFQVTSREEVIGQFNGHLQDCILFVADEAYWGGDKRCVGRLQGMITEPILSIERKGIDIFQVRNFLHMVMLAEPGWVIPAGRYERRYAAPAVNDKRRGDKPYFKALYRQIEDGGAAAMFYDLQRMDLGDWHPRDIPEALLKGAALQKQQGLNLPPLEQWYVMLLHNGVVPGALAGRLNTAYTFSLVNDAKEQVPRLRYDLTEAVT